MGDATPSDAADAERNANPPGHLPPEVRVLQRHLIEAQRRGKGIRRAFDDFCALSFSKPEWAGLASEFLADLFENDEETLTSLARVPDMIIELSEGHSGMTCIVASHWAISGELENLNRLAEAMIAAHSRLEGEAVTELMLALCTSLAVVKHSRAEQLMEIVRPSVTDDQVDSLRDAELWLAVGKIVRTATSEQRRMWNERLRKARSRWTWESADEVRALRHLLDHIGVGIDGTQMFRAVVPPAWWDLAMEVIRERQAPALEPPPTLTEDLRPPALESIPEPTRQMPAPDAHGSRWLFFLAGSLTGICLVILTMWLVPEHSRIAEDQGLSWREEQMEGYQEELADLVTEHRKVKQGTWQENSALLMGTTSILPRHGNRYRLFLEWLQLDPPEDKRTREMVSRLLYERFPDPALIDLWEKLASDETVDQTELRQAASDALAAPGSPWTEDDRIRLQGMVDG